MTKTQKAEYERWRKLAIEWMAKHERHEYDDIPLTAELLGIAHALAAGIKYGWVIGERDHHEAKNAKA